MKKILMLFAVMAIMVGVTTRVVAQNGASATESTNTANAQILTAIGITKGTPLQFGGMIVGVGGTLIMDPDGTTHPTGVNLIGAGGTVTRTPASYEVTGTALASYSIGLPTTITVTNTSDVGTHATMTVSLLTSSKSGNLSTLGSGTTGDHFTVGGTLTIASDQVQGVYSGTFPVTVAY